MWALLFGTVVPLDALGAAWESFAPLGPWLAGQIVGFLMLAIANGRCADYRLNRKAARVASCAALPATLGVFLEGNVSVAGVPLFWFALCLCGLFFAACIVFWVQALAMMDYREVQFSAASSVALGALMALLCSLVPSPLVVLLAALLPVASALLLPVRCLPPPTAYDAGELMGEDRLPERYSVPFLLASVPFALASGFLRGSGYSLIGSDVSQLASFVAIGVGGILFAFLHPQRRVFVASSLLTGGGLVLMAFADPATGAPLVAAGFCGFGVLMYMVCAESVKLHRRLAARIPAVFWLALTLASLAGAAAGAAVRLPDAPPWANDAAYGTLIFLLMVAVALMFTRGSLRAMVGTDASGLPLVPAVVGDSVDRVQLQCLVVGREYGLTKREEEVLDLLARGHGAPYIESELVISRNTVKSHVKSIYRKLRVASREELMAKVSSVPVER